MTHHGSSPGRPRGRRARSDNNVPDWAGYDAVPQDQREFPDLSPIQGQDVRARDGRGYGDPMQDARLPDAPGANGVQGAPGGQAPWQEEPWMSSQAQAPAPVQPVQPVQQPQQAQPQGESQGQPRSAKHRAPQQAPEWAGPDADVDTASGTGPIEAFTERWRRRGSESREERRADRRKQRRFYALSGGAAAVVIAVAVYFLVGGSGGPANLGLGSLVTSFLPGELQQVPGACSSVPGATLSQDLPGQLKVAQPPLNTGATSECTWTLDKAPVYRVLEVNMAAYSPNALVTAGDGSATFAAEYAYAEAETAKQHPGPRSGQPKATVADLSGMPGGSQTSAFEAKQVFTENGAVTDVATIVVRYRNVIVTVVLNGLDRANKGKYGPVSMDDLSSVAQTVAQQVTGGVVH